MTRCTLLRSYLGARRRFYLLRGEALARYQEERARQITAYAVRHSPFYRDLYAGHDLQDWASLPTIDKAQMMAHFDTFNTRGIRQKDAMAAALKAERTRDFAPVFAGHTVGLSSGTSGHRGLFLVSPMEQQIWAGYILARGLHELNWRGCRIAFFLRSNSNLYESVGGRWITFRYFDLMTPIEDAAAALNTFQPDLLVAPPSLLGMLADAQIAGRLRIRPKRLVSVAEVLEPQDEARLSAVFERPVHQVYQCTEGLLAVSCPRGALHIQEDAVALQLEPAPLDGTADRRWMPVVTDLWRRAQPILRYRLNDLLILDPRPCPCGSAFRVIARVEGRCDDVCQLVQPGGRVRPVFPDVLRRIVLLSDPHILDYQVVQERPGHFRFHLLLDDASDLASSAASIRATAAATFAQYDCLMPDLQFEPGLIPQSPGSKRRRVRAPRQTNAAKCYT